jgi:hypothetical protein
VSQKHYNYKMDKHKAKYSLFNLKVIIMTYYAFILLYIAI